METLREYKEQSGFSYSQIGKAIGHDKGYIHRAFHSPHKIGFDTFMRIMTFVGVPGDVAVEEWKRDRTTAVLERNKKATEKLMSK